MQIYNCPHEARKKNREFTTGNLHCAVDLTREPGYTSLTVSGAVVPVDAGRQFPERTWAISPNAYPLIRYFSTSHKEWSIVMDVRGVWLAWRIISTSVGARRYLGDISTPWTYSTAIPWILSPYRTKYQRLNIASQKIDESWRILTNRNEVSQGRNQTIHREFYTGSVCIL